MHYLGHIFVPGSFLNPTAKWADTDSPLKLWIGAHRQAAPNTLLAGSQRPRPVEALSHQFLYAFLSC